MMAGNGDINRPDAWTNDTPALGVGSISTPPAKGDIILDAPAPNDPDFYYGSFTLKAATPTLGVATVTLTVGKGQPESPKTWASVSPTLGVGSAPTPAEHGEIMDPQAWTATAPTLGVSALPGKTGQGDVGDLYAPNEVFAGVMETWTTATPTLGVGVVAPAVGDGDITDPWAWQDVVLYLTSWTYPVQMQDALAETFPAIRGGSLRLLVGFDHESIGEVFALTGGSLTLGLIIYSNWPTEAIEETFAFNGGTLVITTGYVAYTNWPAEAIKETFAMLSGTLVITTGYIAYTNWPAEAISETFNMTGGTLA